MSTVHISTDLEGCEENRLYFLDTPMCPITERRRKGLRQFPKVQAFAKIKMNKFTRAKAFVLFFICCLMFLPAKARAEETTGTLIVSSMFEENISADITVALFEEETNDKTEIVISPENGFSQTIEIKAGKYITFCYIDSEDDDDVYGTCKTFTDQHIVIVEPGKTSTLNIMVGTDGFVDSNRACVFDVDEEGKAASGYISEEEAVNKKNEYFKKTEDDFPQEEETETETEPAAIFPKKEPEEKNGDYMIPLLAVFAAAGLAVLAVYIVNYPPLRR